MKPYVFFRLCFVLLLIMIPSISVANADTSASAVVRSFYNALSETMDKGPELGFSGRYKKLEPAVTKAFNLPLMTRYAVASHWAKASDAEQSALIRGFSSFSVAMYAGRFTRSNGEVFAVGQEKPAAGGGVMVETTLTPKDEAPVVLNYLLRADEAGVFRIVDVYLDASISELATRRAEFSSVIKKEGLSGLIRSLDEKTKTMQETEGKHARS